jgi:hypothetical protein
VDRRHREELLGKLLARAEDKAPFLESDCLYLPCRPHSRTRSGKNAQYLTHHGIVAPKAHRMWLNSFMLGCWLCRPDSNAARLYSASGPFCASDLAPLHVDRTVGCQGCVLESH